MSDKKPEKSRNASKSGKMSKSCEILGFRDSGRTCDSRRDCVRSDEIAHNDKISDGKGNFGGMAKGRRGRMSADEMRLLGLFDKPEKSFFAWFREDVLGLSSESYRREFWSAANTCGHTIGDTPLTFRGWQCARGVRPGNVVADAILIALCLGGPALAFYLVRKCIRRHLAKIRRPTYYEGELLRRLLLGKTRRMITNRRSHNPKPTMDAIRNAWNGARHSPQGALLLGGMLEDLECYVNNHAMGNYHVGYCGRYGGIKRLLEKEAPDLFKHYAALMRYKSIARRYRQACGVSDPIPADALLPLEGPGNVLVKPADGRSPSMRTREDGALPAASGEFVTASSSTESRAMVADRTAVSAVDAVNQVGTITSSRMVAGMSFPQRNYEVDGDSFEMAAKILKRCENSVISLEASLALELDPYCIGGENSMIGPTKSSESCNLYGEPLEDVGMMVVNGMRLKVGTRRTTPDKVAVWLRKRQQKVA